MALLNLDFSNVKELTNLSVGKHVLRVTKVEQVTASTGSPMLTVTFVNGIGEVGIDNFVLTENALWKLQILLKSLFKTEFKGVINLNTDQMIGKTCEATAKEEEYMKQDGTPGLRTTLDNYRPVSDAPAMGIAPTPQAPTPVQPAPVAPTPVQPQYQTPVTPPQYEAPAPVAPTPVQPAPVAPTPVQPAPAQEPAKTKRPWE